MPQVEVNVSPARAAAGQEQRAYTLHFRHLSWTVGKGKRAKTLLDDLSGYAEPSTLTALMGASGSGKSSLLDILAKRKTQGVVEGSILYDTFPLTAGFARRNVGYVEQSPSLIANLTCEEMLLYTAALQRPSSEDQKRQKSEIFELMSLLGLEKRRDVIVGNEMTKGLSGGETKRVTIALGMIREPAVLFLDEPTSGLDSATANEIMRLIKEIANDNRTVITTIHSPTAYCFSLFDKLFLLSSGKVAFFGLASDVEGFLDYVGFSRDQTYTTSEWLVDLLSQHDTTNRLVAAYEESDLAKNNEIAMERLAVDTLAPSSPSKGKGAMACLRSARAKTEPRPSAGQEIKKCFWELRSLVKFRTPRNYTDGAYLGSRIGDKILFMLVIVSLYYGKGKTAEGASYISAMQVLPSVLFMVVVLPAFGAAGYMPSLMLERPIFVRERADGNYHVISYLLYKVLEEFIITVPLSVLFCVAIYYGVGMHGSLVLFWLIFLVTQNIGIVLAYLVAAFAPSVDSANAILPCYVTLCLFFVGLLIPYKEIPVWWSWFAWICPLRYAWSALMMNEYQDDPFNTLEFFSVPDSSQKWNYFGYTCAFYPAFFLGAYVIMSFRKYVKR